MKRVTLFLFLAFMPLVPLGVASAQNPVPLINQPLVPVSVAAAGPAFTIMANSTGALTLTPSALSFGVQLLNTVAGGKTITLTNIAGTTLSSIAISLAAISVF